jgi:hypothetical protein
MKTIRTIATVILAAFMVLGPVAAYAAGATMTISTSSPTYSGSQAITITGTITPAPSIASNVVITTIGPMGAVDITSQPVNIGTGTFSYTFTAGGSAGWTSGTYTVNGTWGASGNTATKTTTFIYSAGPITGPTVTTTTTVTTTSISTTTVTTAVATVTIATVDAAMQSSISSLSSQVTSMQGVLNTISSGVTGLTTSLQNVAGNLQTVNNIGTQLTTLTNAVNNNQTYVLVVAALAAITLVLELAILVRKLS